MAMVVPDTLDRLLRRVRLSMRVAVWAQALLVTAMLLAGLVSPIGITIGTMDLGLLVLATAGLSWFVLLARSLQRAQRWRQATRLVRLHRTAEAVTLLQNILRQFSLLRANQLRAMVQLGRIAGAQGNHATTVALAREVLRHSLTRRKHLDVQASLLLAGSLMELGDTDAAGRALGLLDGRSLRLEEQLAMLPVLLRWQVLCGKDAQATAHLERKVQLACLLEAPQACQVHVLLAVAARRQQMHAAGSFLLRRAALHYDLNALARENPPAASHLAWLQTVQDPGPVCETAGRKAHGQLACSASSRDVRRTVHPMDSPSATPGPDCGIGDSDTCIR
jgi:hypothetical protein